MKKLNLLYAASLMTLSIVSCQQSELFEENAPTQGALRQITVQATMNDGGSDTRASMTPTDPVGTNHDDFTELTWVSEWQAHDKLGAWSSGATTFSEFTIDPTSYKTGDENDDKTASFKGNIPAGATEAYFFYPYDETAASITSDGKYTVYIGTQLCDGGAVFHHYGKSKPMASTAVTLPTSGDEVQGIEIRNLSAGMEYRLYFTGATSVQNDIRVVRLELSGDAINNCGEFDFSTGSLTYYPTTGIRIDVDNSPKLNDYNVNTELYSLIGSIFPFLLPKGEKVTLTVYTNYGKYSKDFTATEGDMDFALGQHHYITMEVPMGSLSSYDDFVGRGFESNPYLIMSRADMERIATNVNSGLNTYKSTYFKMTNDIDLGGSSNEWTAIGIITPFQGTFDGNGKKITGLYISNSDFSYQGLFGQLNGATIKNLGVDGEVKGTEYVGGIVGAAEKSQIIDCYSTGPVTGSGEYVGGVVGYMKTRSSNYNCYNTGTVTGTKHVGGIVGCMFQSNNYNCYNTGKVSGSSSNIGGIVGDVNQSSNYSCYNTGTVAGSSDYTGGIVGNMQGTSGYNKNNNCYNTGTVTGTSYIGGIAGCMTLNNNSNNNCYNTGIVTGVNDIGGIAGKIGNESSNSNCYYLANETGVKASGITPMSETDMKANTFLTTLNTNAADITDACAWVKGLDGYPTLDFGKTLQASSTINGNWRDTAAPNFGGGQGTQKSPYIISTPMELAKLAKDVNAGTTYEGKYFALACDIDLSAKKWTAIGTSKTSSFKGTFNGNNKKIIGLYINSTTANQGLFGYLGAGGAIKNLAVSGDVSSDKESVGGIVGQSDGQAIENCSFSGRVSGNRFVGGIVGSSSLSSSSSHIITFCYNTGTVSGTSTAAGGIAGFSSPNSTDSFIKSCYNTGRVLGVDVIGGIAGRCSSISYCYSLDTSAEKVVGTNTALYYVEALTDAQMKGAAFQYNGDGVDTYITTELNSAIPGSNPWLARSNDYPWLGF